MSKRICSICNGRGKVKNPQYNIQPRGRLASDPVVDVSLPPLITCQNCHGTGWTGKED